MTPRERLPADGPSAPCQTVKPSAVTLLHASQFATSFLAYGTSALLAPFQGGTLVPNPLIIDPSTVGSDGTIAARQTAAEAGTPWHVT